MKKYKIIFISIFFLVFFLGFIYEFEPFPENQIVSYLKKDFPKKTVEIFWIIFSNNLMVAFLISVVGFFTGGLFKLINIIF